MSELAFAWWPYVRNMIRRYPKRKKCAYMPRVMQMEFDAVTEAMERTAQKEDGRERLELIRLTYWRRSRVTLQRAAMDIPVSYSTAKRWNKEFFLEVAEVFGLYDAPEEE